MELQIRLISKLPPKHILPQQKYLELSKSKAEYLLWTKYANAQDSGKAVSFNPEELKQQLFNLGWDCRKLTEFSVIRLGDEVNLEQAVAFAQGFYNPAPNKASEVKLFVNPQMQAEFDGLWAHYEFQRRVVATGADVMTPSYLVDQAISYLKSTVKSVGLKDKAISFKVTSGADLVTAGYVGTWTVGRGAANQPALLEVDFNPSGKKTTPTNLAMVGKGITFDTGGYCIKPGAYMDTMYADMGGAALMVASLGLAIFQGMRQRVKLIICCAENAISSNAFIPGEVIHYPNGLAVVNEHTDAEGRLVLADGLILASQANNGSRPKYILDAATLTGAAKSALGTDMHAILTFDNQAYAEFAELMPVGYEAFWRLPLREIHREQMTSPIADLTNDEASRDYAWASTAAGFLSYFVTDYQHGWLHLDLAGAFNKRGDKPYGATNLGLETVAEFVRLKASEA